MTSLRFVPLGGAGEIGLNVNLYGLGERWMMVDFGIAFADERLPGVDVLLPDISFVEDEIDRLEGLVLTHAHEDHLGAIPYLWERLSCPVYCTAFTAAVLKRKLADTSFGREVPIHVVSADQPFAVGPFDCRFIHMTHSIPEANSLLIETEYGRILHTGDWKLDPEPQLGEASQIDLLKGLLEDGVLALVSDSTNVMTPGRSGSEADVLSSLEALIAEQPHRVILTTFASNVARLQTAMRAAVAAGRQVALVGRSMKRMVEAAREVGYLQDMPKLVDERSVADLPRDKVLILTTGSQAEPRAALKRIAHGQHPKIAIEDGDTVIFSSKIIPGNERPIHDLHNMLARQGAHVITEEDHFVHVSGHPCQEEVEELYGWVKPQIAIPVHGQERHLREHADLAKRLGVPHVIMVGDGDVVALAPGDPRIVGDVEVGKLVLEDDMLLPTDSERFRMRRRLSHHGCIAVTVVLDGFGSVLATPTISVLGTLELEPGSVDESRVRSLLLDEIEQLDDGDVANDERLIENVRAAVRRTLGFSRERRPVIDVSITRLDAQTLAQLEASA
ncbi:MAG: ribonuclease J [Geminicoccaceae bacterium]